MSVQHTPTSIANKPKSVEELTAENERLLGEITDLQLALCEVYELIEPTVYGGV